MSQKELALQSAKRRWAGFKLAIEVEFFALLKEVNRHRAVNNAMSATGLIRAMVIFLLVVITVSVSVNQRANAKLQRLSAHIDAAQQFHELDQVFVLWERCAKGVKASWASCDDLVSPLVRERGLDASFAQYQALRYHRLIQIEAKTP